MARYGSAPAARERGDDSDPQGRDDEDGGEAVDTLPGVVNDLPEVAPHEWIYLMG